MPPPELNINDVTLGELYRVCSRIERRMTDLSDGFETDVKDLRNKYDELYKRNETLSIDYSVLGEKVNALEAKGRDWRGWIAAGVIGAGLAFIPFIFQAMQHAPVRP